MATIIKFVSRSEQVRLRGMRNFAHWNRIIHNLEPFGPAERCRLFFRNIEDEAKNRAWAQRHGRVDGGATVVAFPLVSKSTHGQTGSCDLVGAVAFVSD